MGLDVSHDAWSGAYSRFGRFREALAATIGLELHKMAGFGGTRSFSDLPHDALHTLIDHSDCDGEIAWKDCEPLAKRLREVAPLLPVDHEDWKQRALQFAEGCEEAFAAKEDLEFR